MNSINSFPKPILIEYKKGTPKPNDRKPPKKALNAVGQVPLFRDQSIKNLYLIGTMANT